MEPGRQFTAHRAAQWSRGYRVAAVLTVGFQVLYAGIAVWVGILTWGTGWFWVWVLFGVPILVAGLGKYLAIAVAVVVGLGVDRLWPTRNPPDLRGDVESAPSVEYPDLDEDEDWEPASSIDRVLFFRVRSPMGRVYTREPSDEWRGGHERWSHELAKARGIVWVSPGVQVRLWVSQYEERQAVHADLAPLQDFSANALDSLAVLRCQDSELQHITHLTGLRELILRGKEVTDFGVEHLSGLEELRGLDVSGTSLGDLGLAALTSSNSHLSFWYGIGLRLGDRTLTTLGELGDLKVLDIRAATGDYDLAFLQGHPRLQELHLDRTAVSDRPLRELVAALSLCHLTVGDTAITDAAFSSGVDWSPLRHLDVSNTRVTGRHFSPEIFPHLESLIVSQTPVDDRHLAVFASLPHLRTLGLVGCPVTDDGLRHLSGTSLSHLSLGPEGVTDAGVLELIESLPRLESVYYGRMYHGREALGGLKAALSQQSSS